MAIYHMNVKTISRSAGRSATAAAAYRAGALIVDERTGEVHDYRRKGGVVSAEIHAPDDAPEWAHDRAELWNQAEGAENRRNSTVAREIIVALPDELSAEQRAELTATFAREIVERHKCAVDHAIHAPGKGGDDRNHHAHLLMTTRRLGPDGIGEKTRELDTKKSGEVVHWRERWATLTNQALERAGRSERIDHRTLAEQGIDRAPTVHRGPQVTGIERRGEVSERGADLRADHAAATIRVELRAIQAERAEIGRAEADAVAILERHRAALERTRAAQAEQQAALTPRAAAHRAEVERIRAEIAAGRRTVRGTAHDDGRDQGAEIAAAAAAAKETDAQRAERRLIAEIEAQGGKGYDAARGRLVAELRARIEPGIRRQYAATGRDIEQRRQQHDAAQPAAPKMWNKKAAEEARKAWAAQGREIDQEARTHRGRAERLGAEAQGQARAQVEAAYPELWRRAEAEQGRDKEAKAREYQERRARERERDRGRTR